MNTFEKTHSRRAFVPKSALAQAVEFSDETMQLFLTDGRVLSVPLLWSPLLHAATPEQRAHCEIGGGGRSFYWPDIDEDLSLAGLMAGADREAA